MAKRRKLKRIRLVCNLQVTEKGSRALLGLLEDITVEGMRLRSNRIIETGRVLSAIITLPCELHGCTRIELQAKCVWGRKTDHPDLYDNGFQFFEVMPSETEVIETLIQRFKR
jgi:hypothetical protein